MNRFLNPFRYLAGTKALAWGLLFILLTAGVLCAASMVQDSLLHFAFVRGLSFGRVLAAELALWLLPAVGLYGAGLLVSRSKIRPIDVLGTTAFAQLPLLPMNLPFLFPQMKTWTEGLRHTLSAGGMPGTGMLVLLTVYGGVAIALLVLFYLWNYRAFSVSCNVRGPKAVVAFIVVQALCMIAAPRLVAWML